jgi:radical SAM-linked protein
LLETLKARFRVAGNLRFLSHQEMLRVWQRALIRAGVPVRFSEGFNPHPRVSLPLPRSVGLEAEDELACVCIERTADQVFDAHQLSSLISRNLPDGCVLLDVAILSGKTRLHATGAAYFIPIQPFEKLRTTADNLLSRLAAAEQIIVERRVDERGNTRMADVSKYIKSIYIKDDGVLVRCEISSAGSIRVDEIMSLLQIDASMLTGPVRRMSVQWAQKN